MVYGCYMHHRISQSRNSYSLINLIPHTHAAEVYNVLTLDSRCPARLYLPRLRVPFDQNATPLGNPLSYPSLASTA